MKAKRWPCCRLHCANRRAVMRAGAAHRMWLNKERKRVKHLIIALK
jgi:hypothetical protein